MELVPQVRLEIFQKQNNWFLIECSFDDKYIELDLLTQYIVRWFSRHVPNTAFICLGASIPEFIAQQLVCIDAWIHWGGLLAWNRQKLGWEVLVAGACPYKVDTTIDSETLMRHLLLVEGYLDIEQNIKEHQQKLAESKATNEGIIAGEDRDSMTILLNNAKPREWMEKKQYRERDRLLENEGINGK